MVYHLYRTTGGPGLVLKAPPPRDSLITTTEAGSGHPSTCLCCAEIMAVPEPTFTAEEREKVPSLAALPDWCGRNYASRRA